MKLSSETSNPYDYNFASTSQGYGGEDDSLHRADQLHNLPSTSANLDTSNANFDAPSAAPNPLNPIQSAYHMKLRGLHGLIEKDQTLTSERMLEFLANTNKFECVISISHAKIAQKSYASEKRFFCPPPCVFLSGQGWNIKKERVAQLNRSLGLTNQRDDRTSTELAAYLEIGSDYSKQRHLNFSTREVSYPVDQGQDTSVYNYCAAKDLYISKSDERQCITLKAQILYGCGMEIGTFTSKRMKVISKPSKKKQNMKNKDCKSLFITSGTNVALFMRPRAQSRLTRYLHSEGNGFHGSSTEWGAFTIHLLDDENGMEEAEDNAANDGFVYYGSVVKLIDSVNGVSLPRLRIRKVDKQEVILNDSCSDEPVSQLHKCAFQMIDDEKVYLSLNRDKVIKRQSTVINENRHRIEDEATWTIISTDKTEHRFYEAMGQVANPISPCPVADTYEVNGHGVESCVEIIGRDFKPNLKVWFGSIPVETVYRSEESLWCRVPPLEQVRNEQSHLMFINKMTGDTKLPISLVREDGVIYPSGLTYTYKTLECSEPMRMVSIF